MRAPDDLDFDGLLQALDDPARTAVELEAIIAALEERASLWEPWAHQVAPEGAGVDWYFWLMIGGRGTGKTDGGAHYLDKHMLGQSCDGRIDGGHRAGIIAPTVGDGLAACFYGPSGLRAHNPEVELRHRTGGIIEAEWPNGATARFFGTFTKQDVQRLRAGGNRCCDWYEEFAAMRELQDALDNGTFGLRLGTRPHAFGSTTPRNRPEVKLVVAQARAYEKWRARAGLDMRGDSADKVDPPREDGSYNAVLEEPLTTDVDGLPPLIDRVVITHGTTDDNPALARGVRQGLARRYENTLLGDQELGGKLVGDLGTWFQRAWFDVHDGAHGYPVRVRSWDFAASEPSAEYPDPDYTAAALLGYDARTREIDIEDMIRFQGLPGTVRETFVATVLADGPAVIQLLQQDPGQAGKDQVQSFRNMVPGFIVVSYTPSGPKPTRIGLLQAAAQQRRVHLVRASWNVGFLDEADVYKGEETTYHDDQLDTVSFGIGYCEGHGVPASVIGAADIAAARLGRSDPTRLPAAPQPNGGGTASAIAGARMR